MSKFNGGSDNPAFKAKVAPGLSLDSPSTGGPGTMGSTPVLIQASWKKVLTAGAAGVFSTRGQSSKASSDCRADLRPVCTRKSF